MTRTEFNKLCRLQFGKRKKDERPPTDEQRHKMLLHVVRNRWPVHRALVTPLLDRAWLACCGYLYETGAFIHTSEHTITEA